MIFILYHTATVPLNIGEITARTGHPIKGEAKTSPDPVYRSGTVGEPVLRFPLLAS